MTQSLNHDMFSGYFMDPIPKFMKSNACYNLNSGWTNAAWQCTYGYVYTEVQKAEKNFYGNDNLKGYLGITEILKVELMHRIADTYGPLVYHQLGETPRVYGQQEAYTRFFADLDEGQQLIREYLDEGGDNNKFKEYDMLTNGKTLKEWLKFANSLRLRLAMRISNVDATLAKDQATKALNDNQGVLEGARETIAVMGKNYINPLCAVAGWGEVYMNASMESIVNGYEDPRGKKWYNTALLEGYQKQLLGIPIGLPMKDGSFTQWDCAGASEYLESDKTPADYKDVVSGGKVGKDMKALITISPKWEEDADIETKLEKIITQKWLACWPESYEAWAEQRRTGYPKLFKVQNNTGKVIDTDIMIRRLPFSTDAATADPAQYATLTEKLGGADNGATRLWWDTGKNSF